MLIVIKSISAKSADISGRRIPPNVFIPERRITLPAQFAGKQPSLHHDREHYAHYTCSDKKCRHSVFVPKPTAISVPSMSKLFGKTDFKRMRYPVHVILMALTMFYLGKNSFRNIALILRTVMNVQVSHTTISNWCTRFAPMFQNIAIQPFPHSISTLTSGTPMKLL